MATYEKRRKSHRYPARDRAFALLKPSGNRLGQIRDVSQGGLSFDYVDILGDDDDYPPTEDLTLDVVVTAKSFYLPRVSCKIVYETVVTADSPYLEQGLLTRTRRCGLKFVDLEEEQIERLESFMKTYCHAPDADQDS